MSGRFVLRDGKGYLEKTTFRYCFLKINRCSRSVTQAVPEETRLHKERALISSSSSTADTRFFSSLLRFLY